VYSEIDRGFLDPGAILSGPLPEEKEKSEKELTSGVRIFDQDAFSWWLMTSIASSSILVGRSVNDV
jgi:hypothetical protein